MDTLKLFRIIFLIGVAVALCLTGAGCEISSSTSSSEAPPSGQQQAQSTAPLADQTGDLHEELQMGQSVYNEDKQKVEIIESSPLYDHLRPFAYSITLAA